MKPALAVTVPLAAIAAGLAGWWLAPAAFLASYLVAWWFCLSLVLGVLANCWLHRLTGGAWGEALRAPAALAAPAMPMLALLFLPLLGGMRCLYPPAASGGWLSGPWFALRAVACLLLWSALAWLQASPRQRHKAGLAAFSLIAYGVSVSVAAVDWIMSLTPQWYSSVFGLLCGTVQMMAGMALTILLYAPAAPQQRADLGNLLLMYVLCWAYLEYIQYLVIWAANLPHELQWYLPRAWGGWPLALLLFGIPLLALLQRRLKRDRSAMRVLALLVLAMVYVHTCWLVLPSLAGRWAIELPLAALAVAALLVWPHTLRSLSHG